MADLQGYILLFLVWLISFVLVRAMLNRYRPASCLPPSPWSIPILGHLHLLAPIPHQALHKLADRCGPLIHIWLGSVPCVVVSSAEMAKEFLQTNEARFSNRPFSTAIDYLTYGSQDFIFAPYGPYWKFMKKLCMLELLGGRTLDLFLPVRREEIKRFLTSMLKKAEPWKEVDVGRELIKLTNNVISRMTMNTRCSDNDDEASEVRRVVQETAELFGKFNLSDFIWFCKNLDLQGIGKRLKEVRGRFDAMAERIIKEHEEARKIRRGKGGNETARDLLDILLDISEDESSEMKLTRENIKAFILDVFGAGTETSAATTEWALAELINHPKVLEKVRQEIHTVVGDARLVQESDIPDLPYLQAIVKETLRLHPTAPIIMRESSEACTVAGYKIPAKTRLFVNVYAIGRDPKTWEDPIEFRPERFLRENKAQMDVRGQHFQLLPFGSGRRGCPGTSLALQMVQTTLACMLQCFEWRVTGKVDMEEGSGITLPRAHPLVCVPIARLNPFPLS